KAPTVEEAGTRELPRWQLDSIYRGVSSPEYQADRRELLDALERFEAFCDQRGIGGQAATGASGPGSDATATLEEALSLYLRLSEVQGVLSVYLSLRVSVDSFDAEAQAELSALRALGARTGALSARFKAWLREVDLEAAAGRSELVAAHRYPLE